MTNDTDRMRSTDRPPPGERRRGRPWLVAAGFLLALAATVATVLLTGLFVRAPGSEAEDTRAAFRERQRPPVAEPIAPRPTR